MAHVWYNSEKGLIIQEPDELIIIYTDDKRNLRVMLNNKVVVDATDIKKLKILDARSWWRRLFNLQ